MYKLSREKVISVAIKTKTETAGGEAVNGDSRTEKCTGLNVTLSYNTTQQVAPQSEATFGYLG